MREPGFRIPQRFIDDTNARRHKALEAEYRTLGEHLGGRGIDIESITKQVQAFTVAVPSWGVATGGTRFARFPGPGEPRDIYEKLVDCATIHQLTRLTPRVSPHIPWDRPDDPAALVRWAKELGLGFDAMNSNTFEDQPGQKLSYKFGSLAHTDPAVRQQAVALNKECIETGKILGAKALDIWIGDGGNFPGQIDFRKSLERYLDSVRQVVAAAPADWQIFLEYKLFEPAMYSTIINDWGTAYACAQQLGPQVYCLVDLGHHAPNVNIEMIVARLLQLGKLGGFHFNDSKYGDDDLDAGSIKPFQLFLIFHELVSAALDPHRTNVPPAYMIDQSHAVTDPIESLISSAEEIVRAYGLALLVDRKALAAYQEQNDALMALKTLKAAFSTDITPLLQMARMRAGGAVDPIAVYRESGYRAAKGKERAGRQSL